MNINNKILLPVLLSLLVTAGLITGQSLMAQNQLLAHEEKQQLESLYYSFQNRIDDLGQRAMVLAAAYAGLPEVQQALAENDRERLIELTYPAYLALDQQFVIPQAQFHTPPATSFLRLHSLEKFGDDLSSFRKTVVVVNQEHRPVSGLEKGKGGYGIRGVVPMVYQDQPIGSFEIGLDFDQNFLEEFKKTYQVDLSVYIDEDSSKVNTFEQDQQTALKTDFSLFAATMTEAIPLTEAERRQVFESGQPIVKNIEIQAHPYAMISGPIRDYAGDVVGLVEIIIHREATLAQIATSRNVSLAIALTVTLGLAFVLALILRRLVIQPVQPLTAVAESIALGNIRFNLECAKRTDEIGRLAVSFQNMREYFSQAVTVANRLAEGDLSVQVKRHSEKDEWGRAMAQMVANWQAMVGQVAANVKTVESSSIQLTSVAYQASQITTIITEALQQITVEAQERNQSVDLTATAIEQVTRAIDGVAKGAQEQAGAVNETSQAMQYLADSTRTIRSGTDQQAKVILDAKNASSVLDAAVAEIDHMADQLAGYIQQNLTTARDGQHTSQRAVSGIDQLGQTTAQLAKRIEELGQRSAQIGAIVETIDNIAAQTNLLALNAAIEAARAGEHGKGFAVVADEVRKLAERSSQATQEIRTMILAVQQGAEQAVGAMNQAGAEVEAGIKLTREAGAAFEAISGGTTGSAEQIQATLQAVQVIQAAAGQIQQAIRAVTGVNERNQEVVIQMDSALDTVLNSIGQVSAVIEENTASTEEIAANAAEVNEALENITSASIENAAAIEEVSSATEDMNLQVTEISTSAAQLQDLTQTLQEMVRMFKLTAEADPNEALASIRTFERAHLAWLDRAKDALASGTVIQPVSHTECALGRWYHGRGRVDWGHLPEFEAIQAPHQQFHEALLAIQAAQQRGSGATVTQRLLAELEQRSQQVVRTLEALAEVLAETETGQAPAPHFGVASNGYHQTAVPLTVTNGYH